jgi:hypothetical protein
MERAGMVHALEKIHRLLARDGYLIDIHPAPEPTAIEARVGAQTMTAGWLDDHEDYGDYEAAEEALTRVVNSGLFAVEREGTFAMLTHADTIIELRDYVAEEWEVARIDDLTVARAEELLSTPERDKEAILRESVRIARLRLAQGK